MTKSFKVCIACPIGCQLMIIKEEGKFVVTGNQCNRGEQYGIKEMTNPERLLTTTVAIESNMIKRLPVKTEYPIPKEQIFNAMEILKKIHVKAPIFVGEIIYEDILNLGINVIATREIDQ